MDAGKKILSCFFSRKDIHNLSQFSFCLYSVMVFGEVHDSSLSLSTAMLERNVFSILRGRKNTSVFEKDKNNPCCFLKNKYQVRSTRWDFEPSMVYWCLRTRMLPLSLQAKHVYCIRNNILKEKKLNLFLIIKFS